MDIWTISGIGITATAICVLIKQYRPEFAMAVSLSCGALIFAAVLWKLSPALVELQELMNRASLDNGYFKVLLKSLGICYVTSVASDSCKDAGQAAISGKIELAAKAAILLLALPLFTELVDKALALITG